MSIPYLKIAHLSILIEETGIRWRRALIPYFERRSVVDFTLRKGRALGASKPTVSGIGFYQDKERGVAGVGILSTQRMSRGRGHRLLAPKRAFQKIACLTVHFDRFSKRM